MSDSPSTPTRRSSESHGRMAGEYRLLRKLGEGGFGAVYEAEHPLLKRRAAVKVLHRVADKDSDAVLRFVSEAQAVNQIRNRHIVDVFSFGRLSDGRHFYVMDLLDGVPLDRWLKRQGRVDVATALQLLGPIAAALDLAHGAGIVHRDLKPQNIFLAWDPNGDTVPKLLDFGMAKLMGESPVHTVSGTPIGTPLYMSPEQARGEKVDQRSDVYALGVLAYEMLTGQLPFVGETTVAVLMAHIIQPAPHPSEACPEVAAPLDAPLLRMLDKDPQQRPAGAGEAIAALRNAAEQCGIALDDTPLRLPRPEPVDFGPPSVEEADTLLDESDPQLEPRPASAHSSAGRSQGAKPLWPLWLGLLCLGALLGFVFLRGGNEPHAEPPRGRSSAAPTPELERPAATPSASLPLPGAASASVDAPAPSASAAPSSASKLPDTKRAKPRASASAKIPTDLENPF